jgi:hypothetical protein
MKARLAVISILSGVVTLAIASSEGGTSDSYIQSHSVVDSFHWSQPFPDDASEIGGFNVTCKAKRKFKAMLYKFKDMDAPPPAGLAPWKEYLLPFYESRPYPGSWDGIDHGGEERELVMMEFKDVPRPVKLWLDKQVWARGPSAPALQFIVEEKHHLENPRAKADAVGDYTHDHEHDDHRVMFFPAGAIYEILPLWVAEGSDCPCESSPTIPQKIE